MKIHKFENFEECERAAKEFIEKNEGFDCLPADDPTKFALQILCFDSKAKNDEEENKTSQMFQYKYAKGKPKIILYKTFARWLNAITQCRQTYKEDIMLADNPLDLQLGFMSIAGRKIMRIKLNDLRRAKSVLRLNDIEERLEFSKYKGE